MDQEQQLQNDVNENSIELQYQEQKAQKFEDKSLNEVKNEAQHKKKKVQFRYKEVQQENLKDLKDHFSKFFQMSVEEIKSSFEEMSLSIQQKKLGTNGVEITLLFSFFWSSCKLIQLFATVFLLSRVFQSIQHAYINFLLSFLFMGLSSLYYQG